MHKISIFEHNQDTMQKLKIYLCTAFLASFMMASAQYTEVINSNRPGVSQSAFSVGTNVLQFEVGPYIVNEEHTPLRHEVSGFGIDFAARYGLFFEELELLVQGTFQNDTFEDFRSSISSEDDRSNFKSFTIGAKYLVYDPYKNAEEEKPNLYSWKANQKFKWNSLIPAVAVYAGVNLDSENNPFTPPDADGISPKIAVATQNNFAGGWVFVTNFILNRLGTDYSEFQYILTLTHSFSPQWVVFGETQGIKSDFYSDNLFRFGGAYLWTKDFQLDTAVTFNTKDTPSVFNLNFGASYRFDFHKDKEIDNDNDVKAEGERQSNRNRGKKKSVDFDDSQF